MRLLERISGLLSPVIVLCACTAATDEAPPTPEEKQPIFNAHMHAAAPGDDDAAYLEAVLAEMDAAGITRSVLHISEVSDIADWGAAAPGRFLMGPMFPCWRSRSGAFPACNWNGAAWPDIAWLRAEYERGALEIMGEMTFAYAGVSPADARMDPYWALAEELNIPVAVHIGLGPPPESPLRADGRAPDFDEALGNPSLLRPVLEKHPDLRIWLQHAGFDERIGDIDFLEETFSLLSDYPGIYVDMSALHSVTPPPVHEAALKAFQDRGFIDRVMFATDNWEAAPIIERYQNAEFLSEAERRAIFHDNAERFFHLSDYGRSAE